MGGGSGGFGGNEAKMISPIRGAVIVRLIVYMLPFTVGCASPSRRASNLILVAASGSPLPINATCVAIADVNGDGHQDLVLTVGTHLQSYFGDGAGSFRTTPDRDLDMGVRTTEMALGAFNGDVVLDVATADHYLYTV